MSTIIPTVISTFLSKYKGYAIAVILLLFLTLIGTVYVQHKNNVKLKNELNVSNQNIIALNDTITVTKNKVGQSESDKDAFLGTKVKDLQKLNDSLYIAAKNVKGKVNTITQTKIQVVHDTVTQLVSNSEVNDDTVKINFSKDTVYSNGNFRNIAGVSDFSVKSGLSSTFLTKDEFGVHLITGIKDADKGKPVIFITSDYPGFTATSIDGAVLDPKLFQKQKSAPKLSLGFHIGYDPLYYNFDSKKIGFANQIAAGIGIGYKIF